MEIQNYRACAPGQSAMGKFDIFLPEINILLREYTLFKSKNGHYFITPPSFVVMQENGLKKYVSFCEFSPEFKKRLHKEALELVLDIAKLKGEPLIPEPEQLTFF